MAFVKYLKEEDYKPTEKLKEGQDAYSTERKGERDRITDRSAIGPVCLPIFLILPANYTTRTLNSVLSFREPQPKIIYF